MSHMSLFQFSDLKKKRLMHSHKIITTKEFPGGRLLNHFLYMILKLGVNQAVLQYQQQIGPNDFQVANHLLMGEIYIPDFYL